MPESKTWQIKMMVILEVYLLLQSHLSRKGLKVFLTWIIFVSTNIRSTALSLRRSKREIEAERARHGDRQARQILLTEI